ncbi:MAG: SDR family NAD(P)-dependent oxidoreductase [Myxococcales bacterium]|nr:SDR family NAD(P)-dependent oxidoreductase [Myxococcales bacterium]
MRAAGLNFRDVLMALGMYPGADEAPGCEFAGVVLAVGPGVDGLAPGARVMGMASATFGDVVVVDHRRVAPIPPGLGFAQGATLPLVFLTAAYGLFDLAGLRAGEKVLVHAAAGGVGMAAVQLARAAGAEVFATASPGKWDVLRSMGLDDDHIASSRDVSFEAKFRRVAGAVDVVLDSLVDAFVDAGLRLLGPDGRFLEMGKRDLRDPDAVAAAHPGVSYRAFDLGEASPERVAALLAELVDGIAAGRLSPLPVRCWDVRQAPDAFRFMAQARHVGKLALTMPRPLEPASTALITGGTGALGAAVARHLVTRHGIERLLLISRRGAAAPEAAALRDELGALGAAVTLWAGDVADPDVLRDAIDAIPASHPLRIVVHAAGVLDDGTIGTLTAAQVERVLRPKVDAALHLDRLTRGHDLAAFVLFSSAAGVFGSAGQGNYAGANTVLDALAAQRRAEGLPGQSLAWGSWDAGMVSALGEADRARLARQGTPLMSLAEGLALFDAALAMPDARVAPMVLDAAAVARDLGRIPPLLSRLVRPRRVAAQSGAAAGSFADRLAALPAEKRAATARPVVAAAAAAVLGHGDPAAIDAEAAFADLGVDSLMAVELRNRLRSETGLDLAATVVFDHPSVARLTQHLVERAAPPDAPRARADGGGDAAPSRLGGPALADLTLPAAARPLRLPPWTMRAATMADLDRLVVLERAAYGWIGEDAIAPPALIADRIERLNRGVVPWFWVLEAGAEVVGWAVLQPTAVDPMTFASWAEATDDGSLVRTFDPTGRFVYLVAGGMAKGTPAVGDAIMTLHHLLMLRETGHEALFLCSAMPGFRAAHEATGISPEAYLQQTDAQGMPLDPFVALITASWPIEPTLRLLRGGYPPDRDSGGHGVSIVWPLKRADAAIAELCERINRWMAPARPSREEQADDPSIA